MLNGFCMTDTLAAKLSIISIIIPYLYNWLLSETWFQLTKIKSIHQSWVGQDHSCISVLVVKSPQPHFCSVFFTFHELNWRDAMWYVFVVLLLYLYFYIIWHRYRKHQNNVKNWSRGTISNNVRSNLDLKHRYLSGKFICKCHLQSGDHFVTASVC